ncbi:MAG: hypothetical protein ABIH00_10230 [Armatimonadota bacterium]
MRKELESIIITANSPGEISGWAEPLIKKIKEIYPHTEIYIVLLPCVFSSGAEKEVASHIEGVVKIFSPGSIWSLIFKKSKYFTSNAVILHLGGDIMYAALLARNLKCSAYSYIWANPLWDKHFTGYLVRHKKDKDRLLSQKISKDKIFTAGDLIYDAMKSYKTRMKNKELTVSFLPGSREIEFKVLAPVFMQVASMLKKEVEGIRFNLIVSPYLLKSRFLEEQYIMPDEKLKGVRTLVDIENKELRSDEGAQIELVSENQYRQMAKSHFAVCIPGTKTAQLGALGIPMLTIVPLNRAELIPYFGLAGLLDYLGGVGRKIKYHLIRKFAKTYGFTAQPNILAGEYIVPELVKDLTVEEIYSKVKVYLNNPQELVKMSHKLEDVYSRYESAFDRVIDILAGSKE